MNQIMEKTVDVICHSTSISIALTLTILSFAFGAGILANEVSAGNLNDIKQDVLIENSRQQIEELKTLQHTTTAILNRLESRIER